MKRRIPRHIGLAAAVALLTFVLYLPALKNDFVNWDDMAYVVNNLHIRSLDWSFLRWAFTDMSVSYWHPLAWLSHALDYAVWGLRPAGHHLTSILVHAANAFLVVLLVVRLLETAREMALRSGRQGLDDRFITIAACVTGVLFGIHPLHVESVAWITERKDLLCALFFLSSVLTYTVYARVRGAGQEERGRWTRAGAGFYLLSLGLFTIALLSKPMAVTIPAVLLILDWYPFERGKSLRSWLRLIGEKLPFLLIALGAAAVAIAGQRAQAALVPLEGISVSSRILAAGYALIFYLEKLVVPLHLSPLYPEAGTGPGFFPRAVIALLIAGAITVFCAATFRKRRTVAAIWVCYVVTLLPVLGIVRVGTANVADRFAYLSVLSPFLLAGLAAAWCWSTFGAGKAARRALLAAGIVLAVVLSLVTLRQIAVWNSSLTLWDAVIAEDPSGVPLAYNNRGDAFREAGQLDRAVDDYTTTIALEPSFAPMAHINRGITYDRMGRSDLALADLSAALDLDPKSVNAYVSRGFVYLKIGRLDRALEDLNRAIALDSGSADGYLNRGVVWDRMGRDDRAMEDYGEAIDLNPWDGLAFQNRGALYRRTGREALALRDFRRACELGYEEGCAAAGGTGQTP